MNQGINVMGLYVDDQDAALQGVTTLHEELLQRGLEPALADVTPGTCDVGPDFDSELLDHPRKVRSRLADASAQEH